MPYMACGSCLHIMKSSYPEGFEQAVIATLCVKFLKFLMVSVILCMKFLPR